MLRSVILLLPLLLLKYDTILASGIPADSIPALKEVFADHFIMGASVSPVNIKSEEGSILLRHFNSMTTENVMKMGPIHPEENRYDWSGADSIMAFARRNGIRFRGHTLVWHKQAPEWMFRESDGSIVTREHLLQRLKAHIFTVAGRYKGQVYAWDVVNEAISDDPALFYTKTPFSTIIGEEFIELAFRWAHEADPNALLFYNDYKETDPVKRKKIIEMVTGLKKKGVPIHGIGMQGHWSIYQPSAEVLENTLSDYSRLGLVIHVTELDISIWPGEPERREKRPSDADDRLTDTRDRMQQEQYRMIFDKFRKYSTYIDAVTFWNITDRHSWLDEWPVRGRKDHPLLFDENLQPKASFWQVVKK
jgi:endo-1,4-beta-xylanase